MRSSLGRRMLHTSTETKFKGNGEIIQWLRMHTAPVGDISAVTRTYTK